MSQLNVDTIGGQTGTEISIASGHTLAGTITEFDQWRWTSNVTATEILADSWARPTGTLQGSTSTLKTFISFKKIGQT